MHTPRHMHTAIHLCAHTRMHTGKHFLLTTSTHLLHNRVPSLEISEFINIVGPLAQQYKPVDAAVCDLTCMVFWDIMSVLSEFDKENK